MSWPWWNRGWETQRKYCMMNRVVVVVAERAGQLGTQCRNWWEWRGGGGNPFTFWEVRYAWPHWHHAANCRRNTSSVKKVKSTQCLRQHGRGAHINVTIFVGICFSHLHFVRLDSKRKFHGKVIIANHEVSVSLQSKFYSRHSIGMGGISIILSNLASFK